MTTTPFAANLEDFYAAVAEAVDAAGSEQDRLLLCKLTLLLAHTLDDPARAISLVQEASLDLS